MNEFITKGYISKIDLINESFTIEPMQNYKFEVDKGYKIMFHNKDINEVKLCESETWFKYGNNFASILLSLKHSKNLVEIRLDMNKIKDADNHYEAGIVVL